MVRLWRERWLQLQPIPLAELSVEERLTDLPRPGARLALTPRNAVKSKRWPAKSRKVPTAPSAIGRAGR